MTMISETIEPELKGAERQELSHLDYFRRKIEELRDRGLIAGDAFVTIGSEIQLRREAIDRHGVYRAQLGRARKLVASKNLGGAKEWAERARLTEPEQREAWELEIRALFMIWSSASRQKLTVITSTIGRIPPIAAPTPAPTNADSDSGVSRIRSGPNSASSPLLTPKQPP